MAAKKWLKKRFFLQKKLYEIYSEISNGATRLTSLVNNTATYLVWVDYLTLNEQWYITDLKEDKRRRNGQRKYSNALFRKIKTHILYIFSCYTISNKYVLLIRLSVILSTKQNKENKEINSTNVCREYI